MHLNDVKILPFQLQLEQMFMRTPEGHAQFSYVEELLARERSGYFGEQQLKYPLGKLNFPHYVLHQIRLPYHQNFFQMDTFLYTTRYGVIMDSKNYAGEITFSKDFNQVIQRKSSTNQVYDDPVLQVQEQKYQLQLWLEQHDFPELPIVPLVVITNSRALLKTSDREYYQNRIISLPRLASKLREIDQHFKHEVLTMGQARSLGKVMLRENTPYVADIFARTKVHPNEISVGGICYECGSLSVKRVNRNWQCMQCGVRSRDAHTYMLKDYFLLFGSEITNRQFRWFTGLESSAAAKQLLNRAGLEYTGNTSNRVYHLNFKYFNDFEYIKKIQQFNKKKRHFN
ncbi:nuclease-related domain-containing protein [Bacillaceae bacterium W0354]